MEEAFVAQLLAGGALTALVGDRITWKRREQTAPLPAVVLHVISARRDTPTSGEEGLTDYVVQVDCWGASYASAKAVARAIVAAMPGLTRPFVCRGFVEDESDDDERAAAPTAAGADDLYRTSLDVRVWHLAP